MPKRIVISEDMYLGVSFRDWSLLNVEFYSSFYEDISHKESFRKWMELNIDFIANNSFEGNCFLPTKRGAFVKILIYFNILNSG